MSLYEQPQFTLGLFSFRYRPPADGELLGTPTAGDLLVPKNGVWHYETAEIPAK